MPDRLSRRISSPGTGLCFMTRFNSKRSRISAFAVRIVQAVLFLLPAVTGIATAQQSGSSAGIAVQQPKHSLPTRSETVTLTVPPAVSKQQQMTRPVLLISIDGMMNTYIERNDTPHFDRLISEGVLAAGLQPVFPTKTFPTHYSMVTGLYVENHGIITNRFYDHNLNLMFSYGPPPYGPPDSVWWEGEPIWVTAEKQGKTAATMYWPGSDSEIGGLRPTRYKAYANLLPAEARIDTVISWLNPAGTVRADFATLYFSEIDSRGHSFGPESAEVDEAVCHMDRLMGYLLRRMDQAGLAGQVNLIIVSDHGMAELSEEKVIFLDDIINPDQVDIIDRTPVAMLRPEHGESDAVYRRLKENEEGYSVYLKKDLPSAYRFQSHHRIPEIIMIADVSYSITTRAIFEQDGLPKGGHGYDHRSEEMQALFLAHGPSFSAGLKTGTLKSVHLYELICRLLNITPAPNDGSLESVRHILSFR